ncbi:MAG: hypothetical protein WKG07_04210 [Hymenobacter sp.]
MRISRLADQMSGSEIIRIGNAVSEQIRQGATICNLTIGDFDPQLFPIPAGLRDGVVAAYQAGQTNYPPAAGIADLRQAAADFIQKRLGLSYSPADEHAGGQWLAPAHLHRLPGLGGPRRPRGVPNSVLEQ